MLLLAVTISHSKWHIGYKKKTSIQNTKFLSFTPSPTPHLFEITEKIGITLVSELYPSQVSSVKVE